MQKPNTFDVKELEPNKAEIVITPLATGYGTTLGNALRRVMLSSLPGSAITSMKMKGVDHEFGGIDGVKEDIVQIILNLKQVRLTSHSEEPIKLKLVKKGEGEVTVGDFEKNADVEFVDPKFVIATVTNDMEFNLEVTVEQGIGYRPVEAREDGDKELGEIAIDAIFTPIRNVNFEKENVRVGEFTNYDKLVLTISTDGTIAPEQAVKDAAAILVDQFQLLVEPEKLKAAPAPIEMPEEPVEEVEEELEEEPKKPGRPKKAE